MSRVNTPKDNPVAERFMRTFKEHQINGRTFHKSYFIKLKSIRNLRDIEKSLISS